jgi:hypothetical protein
MKLEAQKAYLAREILTTTDECMINEKDTSKRKIGILDGKSNIQFSDDFEMTTEDLLNLQ